MARPKQLDADAQFLGAAQTRVVGELGDHGGIDVVDKPMPQDALDHEQFMNDVLTIVVNPSQDVDDPKLVQVGVNGVNQFMPRGTPIDVKRKYVEVLARAKRTDFAQTLDDRMGEQMNYLQSMHSLRFPFSVMRDPNPNGFAWLTAILAEAR